MNNKQYDFYPLVILILTAALVLMSGLYAWERSKQSTFEEIKTFVVNSNNKNNQSNTHSESSSFVASNTSNQKPIVWKMVTSWPKNFPGLGMAPEYLSQKVEAMSAGRLKIEVFGANEIVPALEVFDAVSSGSVQAGHSGAYYWKGKIPASVFFTTVPFGMNAQEANAWLYEGGGLKLWQDIYAKHNLVPFPGGNTGVQMGGWFNKDIDSTQNLKGMRIRMPGLAGEVLQSVGGESINLPAGEIYTSLQTGVIDGTEWVGPYNDQVFGLNKIAKNYYYPGWHEPGSVLEFIFNLDDWNALPKDLQTIVSVATQAVNQQLLNEYTARNSDALLQMQQDSNIDIKAFPDKMLRDMKKQSQIVLENLANKDADAKKVFESYQAFQKKVENYHSVSEQSYYELRKNN